MYQIVCCDWLPERARWSYLARSGLHAVSREKDFVESRIIKSFIDEVCSVEMVALNIDQVLFFASLWKSTPSRSINTQKKEFGPAISSSHLVKNQHICPDFRRSKEP